MRKVLLVALAASAGWAAYVHLWPKEPLKVLMSVPASFPKGSLGGIREAAGGDGSVMPEPGRHTVVEFYSPGCPSCDQVGAELGALSRLRPDVAIRKIKLDDELARKHEVKTVPHVLLYDCRGQVLARDAEGERAALELVREWRRAELNRAYQSRYGGD